MGADKLNWKENILVLEYTNSFGIMWMQIVGFCYVSLFLLMTWKVKINFNEMFVTLIET